MDMNGDDFLREQKMVAPTYQELAADQVIGFGSCKDVITILLLVSAVIMLKDTFEFSFSFVNAFES